jgi:hypothetical protein
MSMLMQSLVPVTYGGTVLERYCRPATDLRRTGLPKAEALTTVLQQERQRFW